MTTLQVTLTDISGQPIAVGQIDQDQLEAILTGGSCQTTLGVFDYVPGLLRELHAQTGGQAIFPDTLRLEIASPRPTDSGPAAIIPPGGTTPDPCCGKHPGQGYPHAADCPTNPPPGTLPVRTASATQ